MHSFENKMVATPLMRDAKMWSRVEAAIDAHLQDGDLEGVAHAIACSWWGSDDETSLEYQFNKAKAICTDPRLKPFHGQIWRQILDENRVGTTNGWLHKDEAYRTFTEEYGWDI